ncbi:MAG: RNA polymerase sigma factor [Actinobacteria bacterium]|nr:MAG: RNA polymerase sigma factor [Actinomycetota bacterium]
MQPRLLRSPARLAGASLLRVQTDDRLVALARDGHERAFAAIVERYRPALERYATRLVGPSRGEDAVQQAFVNAHAALISNSPDKTIELRPWLYRIVHNAALNTLRSSRDEQPLGDAAEQLSFDDDAIERRERLREALDALAALPANQRDAILLRELEGRSHDEIAVALGLTPGAARQQIFRARAALRAAATAITPQPLLVRTLELAASGGGSGAADVAAGAGASLTAVLAKAGAGVLVTGAVVGGAVGTGVVHTPRLHEQRPPAAREAAAHPKRSAQTSSHGSASAAAAPAGAGHRSTEADRRSTSHHKRSSDRKHTGDRSGTDRRGQGTTAPASRPVSEHRGPSRTGSTVQEVHHGGSTNDAAGTEHSGSGHHGHHGGRGGGGDTVAGATTQPESTEVETETPEAATETGGGGGGGASSGGGSPGGGGGGGGTQTTTDAQPPATTTGSTVPTAPTNGGGGGAGGATTALPPGSFGGKGK